MKYFKAIPTLNTNVTGSTGGSQVFTENTGNNLAYDSILDRFCKTRIPIGTNFNIFHLNPKAKFTDFLSVGGNSSMGLLVSQKLLDILESYNLPEKEVHPVILTQKSKSENYFWIRILTQYFPMIDFEQTKLLAKPKFKFGDFSETNINSTEDFKRFIADNGPLFSFKPKEKYHFLIPYKELDLIIINLIDTNYYLSQQLADELIRKKITGLDISESTQL